jgi:ribosomal protein S12 methylthiotransferase
MTTDKIAPRDLALADPFGLEPTAALPPGAGRPLAGKTFYAACDISCLSSRALVARHRDFLAFHGAAATDDPQGADIVLVDTCAFSTDAERWSLDLIENLRARTRVGAKFIVTGCLAAINPAQLAERYDGDVLTPRDEGQLARLLGLPQDDTYFAATELRSGFNKIRTDALPRKRSRWSRILRTLHDIDHRISLAWLPSARRLLDRSQETNRHAFIVTVSQGCVGNCTFCAIPMAKGRTRSVALGAIVDQVREIVGSGQAQNIILASEDTGAYGIDIGLTLPRLLHELNRIPHAFRLSISLFDPRWLQKYERELSTALEAGKVRHIQLPIQTASDALLKQMKRGYRMANVLPPLRRLRARFPDLAFTTQIICGFPGETDADHALTRDLLRQELFDHCDVFAFQNRPEIGANDFPDQVPEAVRRARAADLARVMQPIYLKLLYRRRRISADAAVAS